MYFPRVLLLAFCISLTACSYTLRQGMDDTRFVSSTIPAFSATSTLPLATAQKVSSFLPSNGAFPVVPSYLSVYGAKDLESPMAIIVFSTVPNDTWLWDYARISTPDSPIMTKILFDNQRFYGTIHSLNGARDVFTIWLAGEEKAAKHTWLVQRYTALFAFRQNKLILEYREPMPASLLNEGQEIMPDSPAMEAFAQRAKEALVVRFNKASQSSHPPLTKPRANGKKIDTKYLSRFLGSIKRVDVFFPKN